MGGGQFRLLRAMGSAHTPRSLEAAALSRWEDQMEIISVFHECVYATEDKVGWPTNPGQWLGVQLLVVTSGLR